ncbi:MAG: Ig-like domain-containing protein [Clostridiales bacterium]|jgi:hypothetical protein|nr:Ig-like domain-containing protein [Clostridiales bacterium]
MRKKVLSSVIAIALLIGLFALLNLTAFAAPATPYEALNVNFFNGTANICIEGNSGASGAGGTIDLWTWWSNSWYYAWKMVPDANHEYFQFRRQTSATATATTALAPTGGTATAGTRLTLAAASDTADNQWWKLERQDSGRYLITSKADPTLCMAPISAVSGQGIQLSTVPATLAASDTWRILIHSTTATAASQLVSAEQPIQSIAPQTGITVPLGTPASALTLPAAVMVTYVGGAEGPIYISWNTSAYNGNVAGTYELPGRIQLNGLAVNTLFTFDPPSIAVTVESSEPFDYNRAECYTAAEGNIARLPAVRQLANATEARYNHLTGAGIDRTGLNANFCNDSYGTPNVQVMRVTNGVRPTSGTTNGYLSWQWASDSQFTPANGRLYFVLNWAQPYTIHAVRCDWWTDANCTPPTGEARIEWLDGTTWREVTGMKNPVTDAAVANIGTLGMGTWNPVTFDPVTTTQLRLKMFKTSSNGNMGLGEWEVFGISAGGGDDTYHTITATAGANGSISPSGSVSVLEGTGQTFTFTPNSGYEVDTVTVDGTAVPAAGSYSFTNVTTNHTINVTFKALEVLVDQPEIEEARIITAGMIELHWKVHTKWTGSQAAYRYSDNHPDTLSGAGSSLNFFSTQNNHNANFRVQIDGVTIAQRTGTFSPYYWHADNYLLHQVRMNQHVSTLRLNANLTSAQQTALQNGTSTLTVQIIGDVTNRAGVAADKTKVYTAIWKPYYDKLVTAKTGLGIRGSQYVDMRTVEKAAGITDVIMSAMPQAVVNTISSQGAFLLFGPGEHSGNIPEQRNVITYDQFNRAEGYGGTNAATSAANVERCNVVVGGVTNNPVDYYPAGYRSGYQHESILAHEFGHKIQSAFNSVFASTHPLRQEFTSAFSQVTSRVMWTPYVRDASGGSEYFATMTSVWYNGMSEGNAANCNTRDEFHRYDRRGYDFFSKLFSVDKVILSPDWANCPNTAAPTWATGNADPNTTRQTRALLATPDLPPVAVNIGTPISAVTLPEKVQVAFADSFSTAPLSWSSPYGLDLYPVTWDTSAYDGNVPGTYIIEGTPHASYPGRYLTTGPYTTDVITNPDNVKAIIEVTVESPLIFEIANVKAAPGSTVDVTYKVSGNLFGYANLDLSIPYLGSIYTPKTVTPGPGLNPMFFIVNPTAKPDLMRIVYIASDNVMGDGLIFTVSYQVDPAAPFVGEYALDLEVVKVQYGIDDDTMGDLKYIVKPGALFLGIMGDIDGNGKITPEDAMLLLQMYVGLVPWTAHALAFGDVNGDGVIDTTDAAIILRIVVGG